MGLSARSGNSRLLTYVAGNEDIKQPSATSPDVAWPQASHRARSTPQRSCISVGTARESARGRRGSGAAEQKRPCLDSNLTTTQRPLPSLLPNF